MSCPSHPPRPASGREMAVLLEPAAKRWQGRSAGHLCSLDAQGCPDRGYPSGPWADCERSSIGPPVAPARVLLQASLLWCQQLHIQRPGGHLQWALTARDVQKSQFGFINRHGMTDTMTRRALTMTTTTPSTPVRRWRRRRLVMIPLVLLILLASGAGVMAWQVSRRFDAIQRISTPAPLVSGDRIGGDAALEIDTGPAQSALRKPATTVVTRSMESPLLTASQGVAPNTDGADSITVLLMGVDARPGEAIDTEARPDAIAVLHADRTRGTCRMLAVPRDTRIDLPGYGKSKANHALVLGGIPYQQMVISDYLGISIDHYGLIAFGGIVAVVDQLGGVEIDNPDAFTTSSGTTFPAGRQTLDGDRALEYARYRGGSDGDFGRIGRQQQILRALLDQATGQDLLTLIPQSLPLLEEHTRTDLSLIDLLDVIRSFQDTCTSSTLETETLPGTTATYFDPILRLELSYVIVEEADVQRLVAWLMSDER